MPSPGVRQARVLDSESIGVINTSAWRDRMPGILPTEFLDLLSPEDLAMSWASGILNPPQAGQLVLVAVDYEQGDQEAVRGYAAISPCADPDAAPDEVELVALEVDPAHRGAGHGSRLMAAAMDIAVSQGATSASCWCALDDAHRRQFLVSAGWGPDGAFRDLEIDPGVPLREVRLVTSLAD